MPKKTRWPPKKYSGTVITQFNENGALFFKLDTSAEPEPAGKRQAYDVFADWNGTGFRIYKKISKHQKIHQMKTTLLCVATMPRFAELSVALNDLIQQTEAGDPQSQATSSCVTTRARV